ncbi:9866_t:CDS:2, partial [Rhizophagus irregularis]
MGRKRTISSVLDENPITTRSPRVTTRSIVQPRIHNELSEVLENTEIRDNEPSEVLENTENINDESSQLTILNEQRVDRLPQRCRS